MAHSLTPHLAKTMKVCLEADQYQVQETHLYYVAKQLCNNKQLNHNLTSSTITYQMTSHLEYISK